MSREYLELGPVPIEEECAQVGSPDFERKAKLECKVYIAQLKRMYPGMNFAVRGFDHDFGRYYEVIVFYDPDDLESSNNAFAIEENLPYRWDEIAKSSLQHNLEGFTPTN